MLDELQTHMADCRAVNRPVVLRSKKPRRIFIAYNAVRGVMADVADEYEVEPTLLSLWEHLSAYESICGKPRSILKCLRSADSI